MDSQRESTSEEMDSPSPADPTNKTSPFKTTSCDKSKFILYAIIKGQFPHPHYVTTYSASEILATPLKSKQIIFLSTGDGLFVLTPKKVH